MHRWTSIVALIIVFATGCGGKEESSVVQPQNRVPSKPAPQKPPAVAEPEPPAPPDRDQVISQSEKMIEQGRFDRAAAELRSLLVVDPTDVEVVFRLASLTAQQGDLAGGIELLDSIPVDHPEAGFPALGQSADWSMQLKRYEDAERRYRKVLELFPQSPVAHRKLAYLLNCQGRRHEAATHIYELCKQGNVRQDELHALNHLSHAMYDDPSDQPASEGEVKYWPIGPAAEARRLFTAEEYQAAAEQLDEAVTAGDQPAAVVALFGRAAAEAQDQQRFDRWLAMIDSSVEEHAEYWSAIGLHLITENRHAEAARALLEAIDRDPTDYRSIGRLRSALETLGRNEEASRWDDRAMQLQRLYTQNNRVADAPSPNIESFNQLADMLDDLDRPLEAVLWRSIGGYYQGLPKAAMSELNSRLGEIVRGGQGLPSQASRLCRINPADFPLPRLEPAASNRDSPSRAIVAQGSPRPAAFQNIADEVGLQHAYQVASTPQQRGFSVYQSVGGAVAVIDFDLDGNADLYFAQGGADPPDFVGQRSNQLFRQLGNTTADVTQSAAAEEYRYSMGVTAGDWNQDGFPDLVIANIGANTLLINNGDGTFQKSVFDNQDDKTLMTTSLAIGDLNRDRLPDVFELNYLHDAGIGRRPSINAAGEVTETMMPKDFQPGLDRLILNHPDGQPTFENIADDESAARAGLGVVVGDFDHQPGNEVFVGNDVYPNQLWTLDQDSGTWVDMAMVRGCAYGFSGAKTASMGIAAGDFDGNGWLDFHITNFQGESVSHYLNDGGSYRDRNVQFNLAEPTQSVLGFGTQAIDYDNDSDLDLVVSNGHIEDAVNSQAAFEQPMQLFCNLGDRFELTAVEDGSGYWSDMHVGRGVARLDWNRDGKSDFVVTHLGERSALLVNRTDSSHHWLQVVLQGVESERDAVGARVTLRLAEGRELTRWVTAGDGFFCRNEPVVAFGLGQLASVESMTVIWPSGRIQKITAPPVDRRLLVIENESQAFVLDSGD